MSVTDTRSRIFPSTGNRNGPDLQCGPCYEPVPTEQTVYLGSFRNGIFVWHRPICSPCWDRYPEKTSLQAICRDHRGTAFVADFAHLVGGGQRGPAPCVWCGRPVVTGLRANMVACSERCRVYAARERARQRRIDYPDACDECGAPMPGCRRNRDYCSPACRQKAYRKRVGARAAERAAAAKMFREYNGRLGGAA